MRPYSFGVEDPKIRVGVDGADDTWCVCSPKMMALLFVTTPKLLKETLRMLFTPADNLESTTLEAVAWWLTFLEAILVLLNFDIVKVEMRGGDHPTGHARICIQKNLCWNNN